MNCKSAHQHLRSCEMFSVWTVSSSFLNLSVVCQVLLEHLIFCGELEHIEKQLIDLFPLMIFNFAMVTMRTGNEFDTLTKTCSTF